MRSLFAGSVTNKKEDVDQSLHQSMQSDDSSFFSSSQKSFQTKSIRLFEWGRGRRWSLDTVVDRGGGGGADEAHDPGSIVISFAQPQAAENEKKKQLRRCSRKANINRWTIVASLLFVLLSALAGLIIFYINTQGIEPIDFMSSITTKSSIVIDRLFGTLQEEEQQAETKT